MIDGLEIPSKKPKLGKVVVELLLQKKIKKSQLFMSRLVTRSDVACDAGHLLDRGFGCRNAKCLLGLPERFVDR
jgi:hypothetical protein